MKKEEYPAWGRFCSQCGKKNHFAVKCAVKTVVHAVDEGAFADSSSDEESVEWINIVQTQPCRNIRFHMILPQINMRVTFQVDTAATVILLPVKLAVHYDIKHSRKQLVMWNGSKIAPVGECRTVVKNPKNGKQLVFH